jgi:hypothetical protein
LLDRQFDEETGISTGNLTNPLLNSLSIIDSTKKLSNNIINDTVNKIFNEKPIKILENKQSLVSTKTNSKTETLKKSEDQFASPLQETLIQEPIIQETLIQEPIIQEPIIQEPIIQETLIQEPLIQEPIIQEHVVEYNEIVNSHLDDEIVNSHLDDINDDLLNIDVNMDVNIDLLKEDTAVDLLKDDKNMVDNIKNSNGFIEKEEEVQFSDDISINFRGDKKYESSILDETQSIVESISSTKTRKNPFNKVLKKFKKNKNIEED